MIIEILGIIPGISKFFSITINDQGTFSLFISCNFIISYLTFSIT